MTSLRATMLAIAMISIIIAAPLAARAGHGGLISCGASGESKGTTAEEMTPCSLCHLFVLGQKILNFLMWTAAPALAALGFAIGGFKMLISGPNPGLQQDGIETIKNTVYGLLIVFGAWIIINQLLLALAGGTTTGQIFNAPWNRITCPSAAPAAVSAVPPAPPVTVQFLNTASPELSILFSCVLAAVPTIRLTSITDDNIAAGLCNPADPNELFQNQDRCQHARFSCHYGGRTCVSRGSFAFDFGINQATDPSYATVRNAVMTCNANASVLNEGNHGHVSIGSANGCGCN